MTGDKHRQPGDLDKHLATWRADRVESSEVSTEHDVVTGEVRRRGVGGDFRYAVDENTDIATTINQAIVDIDDEIGGKVLVPIGDFDVGEQILIPDNTDQNENYKPWHLLGQGTAGDRFPPMGTTLRSTISDGSDVIKDSVSTHGTKVGGFAIIGNGSEGAAVNVSGQDQSIVKDITVFGTGGKAGVVSGNVDSLVCRGTDGANSHGWEIGGGRIIDIEAERCDRALFVNRADGLTMNGPNTEGADSNYGLFIDPNSYALDIRAGRFVDNNNWGVQIRAGRDVPQDAGVLRNILCNNNTEGGLLCRRTG